MGDFECLGNLIKYLPFVEFLRVQIKDDRLIQIQKWIKTKTNVTKGSAEKIMALLVHLYRNLHLNKTETPEWVDAIFNNGKCVCIDLCDDDDSDVEFVESKESTDNSTQKDCDTKLFERRNQITESINKEIKFNVNDTVTQLPAEPQTSSKNQSVVEKHEKFFLDFFENVLDSKKPDKKLDCKSHSKEENIVYGAENQNTEITKRLARIYDDFTTQNVMNNINLNTIYQNQGTYPNGNLTSASGSICSSSSTTFVRTNTNDPRIKSSGQSKIYGTQQQNIPKQQSLTHASREIYGKFEASAPKPKLETYGDYRREKLWKMSQSKLITQNKHSNASIQIQPKGQNQIQTSANKDSAKTALHPHQNCHSKEMKTEIVKATQSKNLSNTDHKVDRALKQLHMDFNGYNQLQDFMLPTGKRRSSICASSAIAEQIKAQHDDDQDGCNKKAKTLKRRKSMCEKKHDSGVESHMCDLSSSIGKRRLSFKASNQISNKIYNPNMNKAKIGKPNVNLSEKNSNMSEESKKLVTYKPLPKRRASIIASNAISMQLKGTAVNMHKNQSQDDRFLQDIPRKVNDSINIIDIESEKQDFSTSAKTMPPGIKCVAQTTLNNEYLPKYFPKESKEKNTVNSMRRESIYMMQNYNQISKKNIDCNMTERNSKTCVLCESKPYNLTNHYVGKHKTESYVSRLSSKTLQKLQINIPYATCVSINNFTKYLVKCIFCGEIITNEFLKLYDHFSIHTGEYAYKCSGCGLQKPTDTEMAAHREKSKKCNKKKKLILYSYNPYQMVIELYWCRICNFVQLNAANVGKHILEQHDRNPISSDIQRLVLVAIQNEPNVVNEPITEDDNINETTALSDTTNPDYASMDIEPIITTDGPMHPASYVDLNQCALENYFDIENVKRELDDTIDNHFTEIETFDDVVDTIKPENFNFNDYEFGDDTDIDYGYKPIPAGTSYFGLYKCMGAECFYSTDVDFEFANHIQDHKDSNCPEIDILYCAYCTNDFNEKFVSVEDLIAHLKECHENSVFHCNYCCYRSCVPGNVLIHLEAKHGQLKAIVVECGIKQIRNNHKSYLLNQLKRNVDELTCKYCSETYYAVESIVSHIENFHGVPVNPIEFKSYSCVYCVENFFELGNIELHLANKHPNEEPYICQRDLRKHVQVETVCDLVCRSISKYVPKDKIISWTNQNLDKSNEEPITHEDSTELLLYQLTQSTGVPPDHLYLCPKTYCLGIFSTYDLWFQHITRRHGSTAVSCPYSQHCKNFELMDLAEFEQHFPIHCLHRYVCFQCGKTFRYDYVIYEHCCRQHNNAKEDLRFEKIIMNERFCYYIVIPKNMYIDEKIFSTDLQILIKKRLVDLANKKNLRIVSYWTVPLTAKWIEAFPKYSNITETSKCKIKACTFVGNSIEIFKHIKQSHKKNVCRDFTYGCSVCKNYEAKIMEDNSVANIEDHIKMHADNLYICCLCLYYHYNKNNMSMHCYKVHNHLDVPIVNLTRSNTVTTMSLTIVFGLEQTTFSTIQSCFCCNLNLNDLKQISYVKHLTTDHKLKLEYACAYCNQSIECLTKSQQHFAEKHQQHKLKINCKVCSFSEQDLILESLDPLAIRIASTLLDYTILTENIKKEY